MSYFVNVVVLVLVLSRMNSYVLTIVLVIRNARQFRVPIYRIYRSALHC